MKWKQNMKEVWALAKKDLALLLNDKVGFFFVFFFPLVYAIFFGVIMSQMGGGLDALPIAVVDEDGTAESAAFVQTLREAPEVEVTEADRSRAEKLVRSNQRAAYVVLRKGFGESRRRMFWSQTATIELGIDPSRQAEAGMLQGVLMQYAFEGMRELFNNPASIQETIRADIASVQHDPSIAPDRRAVLSAFLGSLDAFLGAIPSLSALDDPEEPDDPDSPAPSTERAGDLNAGAASPTAGENGDDIGWQPIRVEVHEVAIQRAGFRNPYNITFPQSGVWGMMGCAAAFGISIVVERTRGTLVRLRTAPIGRAQILAGKAVACLLSILGVTTLLYIIAFAAFGVRPGSWGLLAMAVVSAAIAFVGIMMLLSVMGKTEASAGGIGWAVLLVLAMIGGGMMPLAFMPRSLQTLSHVSPIKWAIYAMEGAIWRNLTIAQMLTPCAILIGIGAVCFLVGARAFRWIQE